MKSKKDINLKFYKKRLWGRREERKVTYKGIRSRIKILLKLIKNIGGENI